MSMTTRRAVISTLTEALPDAVMVCNLGSNSYDVWAATGSHQHFYLWGAMGLTHSVGLGVALERTDTSVIVLDGDGSLLMGMSGLSTIGVAAPPNLLHVALDNEMWANTGGQPTHTAEGTDLAQIATGCGYKTVLSSPDPSSVEETVERFRAVGGPLFLHVKIAEEKGEEPVAFQPEPVINTQRFRRQFASGQAG